MRTSLPFFLLPIAAPLVMLLIDLRPAVASPTLNEPLSVVITLASAKTIVPGQPIVLRYSIANNSAFMSAHFDLGQNGTMWYRLSLVDSVGASAQTIPDLRPSTYREWGLYQTSGRTLSPGDSLQGSIVVTRKFATTWPGKYFLTVQVPLDYTAKGKTSSGTQATTQSVPLRINQNFTYQIEVEAANPAAVEATAETLRRKLMNRDLPNADQWEPVVEELFSMPEAQALSSWQALLNDPTTSDGVRVEVANQLAYHPSHSAADLLGQMLWNTPMTSEGGPSLTELSRSEIARALMTMKDVASPDVRQQIQLLYSQHQGQASEVRGASVR